MSLIINADSEYLSGSGVDFGATGLTEATFGLWVKRDSGTSTYQSYAYIGRNATEEYGSIVLAHNGSTSDCFLYPSGGGYRVNTFNNANSSAWQLLVLTTKKDAVPKVYVGISGGSLTSVSGPAAVAYDFNSALDNIRVGGGFAVLDGWFPRARLAHCFFYDKELTATQVGELFNGGTAAAGKNPQAVQAANLKFYAPLASDATVTVSGITLSATGTLTYDGADNPNVEAYGASGGSASGATITGTASLSAGSATGTAAGSASGATLTGTASLSAGSATGGGTGSFTTAAMENNTGAGLLASASVVWTWYQGSIGGAPAATVSGTGTTNSSGILTVSGLPIAAGFLMVTTVDGSGVYYQSGTPA